MFLMFASSICVSSKMSALSRSSLLSLQSFCEPDNVSICMTSTQLLFFFPNEDVLEISDESDSSCPLLSVSFVLSVLLLDIAEKPANKNDLKQMWTKLQKFFLSEAL